MHAWWVSSVEQHLPSFSSVWQCFHHFLFLFSIPASHHFTLMIMVLKKKLHLFLFFALPFCIASYIKCFNACLSLHAWQWYCYLTKTCLSATDTCRFLSFHHQATNRILLHTLIAGVKRQGWMSRLDEHGKVNETSFKRFKFNSSKAKFLFCGLVLASCNNHSVTYADRWCKARQTSC